jgi:hypothetical protein
MLVFEITIHTLGPIPGEDYSPAERNPTCQKTNSMVLIKDKSQEINSLRFKALYLLLHRVKYD